LATTGAGLPERGTWGRPNVARWAGRLRKRAGSRTNPERGAEIGRAEAAGTRSERRGAKESSARPRDLQSSRADGDARHNRGRQGRQSRRSKIPARSGARGASRDLRPPELRSARRRAPRRATERSRRAGSSLPAWQRLGSAPRPADPRAEELLLQVDDEERDLRTVVDREGFPGRGSLTAG